MSTSRWHLRKIRASPKSVGFILWGPRMGKFHPIVVDIFQSGPKCWTNQLPRAIIAKTRLHTNCTYFPIEHTPTSACHLSRALVLSSMWTSVWEYKLHFWCLQWLGQRGVCLTPAHPLWSTILADRRLQLIGIWHQITPMDKEVLASGSLLPSEGKTS